MVSGIRRVAVRLEGVSKSFGSVQAVDSLDIEIQSGEFFAMLGPSGCGKTTTLRMIAGLEEPSNGAIYVDGTNVTDLPPYQRNLGMVFQDYALFPHMTVFDNIAFGLRMRDWPKAKVAPRIHELLEMIGLPDVARRYPSQLSGGQQQRIALARSLAPAPSVLLLDEPLSNLDLKLRHSLRLELRRIQRTLKVTTVFVTHDQGEALALSDRVMVMDNGRAAQIDTPEALYMRPATPRVASFLGDANIFRGVVNRLDNQLVLQLSGGAQLLLPGSPSPSGLQAGDEIVVAVRPEHIRLRPAGGGSPSSASTVLEGAITNLSYLGSGTRYLVALRHGEELIVDVADSDSPLREGTPVELLVPRERVIAFDQYAIPTDLSEGAAFASHEA